MKRFFADAILILTLVTLGGYLHQQEPKTNQESVEQQVEEFENAVAQHETITPKTSPISLENGEDNNASRFAQAGSELVVKTMHGSLDVISSLFDNLLK